MHLLFGLLVLANLFSVISVSIIAPFFPPLAEEKGFSEGITGFVLSANPLGSFVASFILGKTMTKVATPLLPSNSLDQPRLAHDNGAHSAGSRAEHVHLR